MVAGVSAASASDLAAACRPAALALQRLCAGDLRGMFDGETSEGLDLEAPLVVLDLSAVRDSAALGILMTCAGAWLQGVLAERKRAAEQEGVAARQMILVVEEGWRVTAHIGAAEWLQENWKLCRGWGIQNVLVVHRLSDLGASGEEGSREARIAEGLLSDADTKVVYAQSPDQAGALRSRLGLTATEADLATTLRPGEALWVVGRRSFLVSHRVSSIERPLVFTDWQMGWTPAYGMSAVDGEHRLWLGLGIAAALVLVLIWATGALAGALFGSGPAPIPAGATLGVALRLPSHLGDPRVAWPPPARGHLPGAPASTRPSRFWSARSWSPASPPRGRSAGSRRQPSGGGACGHRRRAGRPVAIWPRCGCPPPRRGG